MSERPVPYGVTPEVKYGAEGLGIGQRYPVADYPFTLGVDVPVEEVIEAGFDRNPDAMLEVFDSTGRFVRMIPFPYLALRDEDGDIVAVYDEGRWWTPEESAAFLATLTNPTLRIMAEAVNDIETLNREQRRRKRRGK